MPTNPEARVGHIPSRKRDVKPTVLLHMHCHSSVALCCYTAHKGDVGQHVSTTDPGADQRNVVAMA